MSVIIVLHVYVCKVYVYVYECLHVCEYMGVEAQE